MTVIKPKGIYKIELWSAYIHNKPIGYSVNKTDKPADGQNEL